MEASILSDVTEFLNGLSDKLAAKIYANLKNLEENRTAGMLVKPLKGPIMELSVKQYRIVFFRKASRIYFVRAFKKQSQKTPKRIIDYAESIYGKV